VRSEPDQGQDAARAGKWPNILLGVCYFISSVLLLGSLGVIGPPSVLRYVYWFAWGSGPLVKKSSIGGKQYLDYL
jgi:hypothetical protein